MKSARVEQIVPIWVDLGLLSVAAAWIWGICLEDVGTKLGTVAVSLTALYLGMHGRILVHELGHLIAAKAVGLRQRKVQVGVGPLIWSRLFRNGLVFEWRMFPRGGWVLALPVSDKDLRIRQLLFISAGPLMDGLLICVLFVGLTSIC